MKKRIFGLASLMVIASVSVALAAVSSPCGARKPVRKEAPAPRVQVESDYHRNVLDQRLPVQTEEGGTLRPDKATGDRERLSS